MILAIDIGGTKFTVAAFDGDTMVRRESRATDAAGGREWMTAQIAEIIRAWRADMSVRTLRDRFRRAGGLRGPAVVLSTHVGGWRDFDLCGFVREHLRRARRHGQRRQCGSDRRGACSARPAAARRCSI